MNKMPSLKDVMLGRPVVREGASQSFNKPLTLANVLNLAGSEIDELTKWKPGPGATKQHEPERAYSDEHDVLGPSGEPTGERFPTDAGTPTVDPERTADPNAKIPGHDDSGYSPRERYWDETGITPDEVEESEGEVCPHCGAQTDHGDEDERVREPDEKEMEDAEADDTLQYTGVGGDDVEEFWVDTTKKGDKASTGYKADNHPMDLGSGFDFGGGHTGPDGSKTKFLQKMPPKRSVHDEPYKFTGDLDRKAYKKAMGRGF